MKDAVRRDLTRAERRDPAVLEPLVRLAMNLSRRGCVDRDIVGAIDRVPVSLAMLKAVYELYACVPFGQWPVPANVTVLDHEGNEWRMPGVEPKLTDIVRSDADARAPGDASASKYVGALQNGAAANDAIARRVTELTVVQQMCADDYPWAERIATVERTAIE